MVEKQIYKLLFAVVPCINDSYNFVIGVFQTGTVSITVNAAHYYNFTSDRFVPLLQVSSGPLLPLAPRTQIKIDGRRRLGPVSDHRFLFSLVTSLPTLEPMAYETCSWLKMMNSFQKYLLMDSSVTYGKIKKLLFREYRN